jgi:hypothetical protein
MGKMNDLGQAMRFGSGTSSLNSTLQGETKLDLQYPAASVSVESVPRPYNELLGDK